MKLFSRFFLCFVSLLYAFLALIFTPVTTQVVYLHNLNAISSTSRCPIGQGTPKNR